MMQQESTVRTVPGLVGSFAPASPVVQPSQAAFADRIAADTLSGPGVVAVDGGKGTGKTAMLGLVAARLRGRGRLIVPVAELASSPVTPQRMAQALLLASGAAAGSDDIPPDRLLRSLLAQPGLDDLVLLIDDADTLPPETWRFLDLLYGLAQFGRARLRLVLFGAPGCWPTSGTLHRLARSPMIAEERKTNRAEPDAGAWGRTSMLSRIATPLRRTWVWPALAVAVPGLAAAVALAVFADRPHRGPADTAPAAVASAEPVLPTEAGKLHPPAADPTPAPGMHVPGAFGKATAGAAALGMVLARVDAVALETAQRGGMTAPLSTAPLSTAQPSRLPSPAAAAVPREPPQPVLDHPAPMRGLLLVARPGDTLATLYSEVYRGRSAPPFADISAANPAVVRPGALVVFPEPPGGWARTGADP